MATVKYRNNTKALNLGWKIETTEGTAATMTQTEFTGDWSASVINPKYTTNPIIVGGQVGTSKLITSKYYGELQNFKMPLAGEDELNILGACGAFVTQPGPPITYDFGGNAYNTLTAAQQGRIATSSLTFVQFDGAEAYTLTGARASSLKFGAKAGEPIYIDAAFAGNFSKANSGITWFQKPSTNFNLDVIRGNALTINSQAFEYLDIEIDLKPDLKMIESGSASSGYSGFEIVNLDPRITVTLYPGDPTTADLWSMLSSNTAVPFAWTWGSGTANVYTLTATVQIESQEASYGNNVQNRKLVLVPVYNVANAYQMRLSVQ